MECPGCDGMGCDHCQDGHITIHGCPQKLCRDVIPAITMIDLFHRGLSPVDGGTLDQAAWFVHAAQLFKTEEDRIKAERHGSQ